MIKHLSRVFKANFEEVSRECQGCFKGVFRVFQCCFKEVSRKCSRCFIEVSCCLSLIAATREEEGLVILEDIVSSSEMYL